MQNISRALSLIVALAVMPAALHAAEPAKPAAKTAAAKPATKSSYKTEQQKVSYVIGLNVAANLSQLKTQGEFPVDVDAVVQGLKDGMAGTEPKMSREEIAETMQAFQQKMEAKQQEKRAAHEAEVKKTADKNKKDGEAYLAANAKKKGVKTTKSGLQYRVIEEGKGPKPKQTDTVTVNYRGTLIDGTEFDSSYKRGEPATFAVDAVIPGWTEALQMMTEGSKWELVIPSDLAYGPGGTGAEIGPNAVLVFEVELLKAKADSGD